MLGRLLLVVAMASSLLWGAAAAGSPPIAVVTTVAWTYLPGDVEGGGAPLVVSRGGRLFFANADPLGAHSIVSIESDEAGTPLFRTGIVNMGEASEVEGVSRLSPGDHPFFCDVHGDVMFGSLRVEG